jgi:hypothetical protein
MGGDMMAALGRAAVGGQTLFGHSATGHPGTPLRLELAPGRLHAADEKVRATHIELPQTRRTHTVLGGRVGGGWGYYHGLNDFGVAAGCTHLRTRLRLDGPGLAGPDLVRLALERGSSARHALDTVTGLIARHGQGAFPGCPAEHGRDAAIFIADAREAVLIEASGPGWVCQEVGAVRVAADVCTIRQDWDAIAPGLAGRVIGRGWWPEDGSKLDFAGVLAADEGGVGPVLRRWGQATRLLEEQSGHIDGPFLRRVLSDQAEGGCSTLPQAAIVSSLVAVVGADVPLAWWGFGLPPGVYLPLLPLGELPAPLAGDGPDRVMARLRAALEDRARGGQVRAALEGLQALFDAEAAEFMAEAAVMKKEGRCDDLRRQATLFMQHAWEELAEVIAGPAERAPRRPPVAISAGDSGEWCVS